MKEDVIEFRDAVLLELQSQNTIMTEARNPDSRPGISLPPKECHAAAVTEDNEEINL